MATRLVKVLVVDTSDNTRTTRYIAASDIHEVYATSWTVNDKTYTGTLVERYPGANPENLTITEAVGDFVTRVNSLYDCPPCPEPNGKTKG